MEIERFLHQHPLKLSEVTSEDGVTCKGCNKDISGQAYGCNDCQFFLHKSCSELPQVIEHFFHPCPLFLGMLDKYTCDACNREHSGFTYRCHQCDFDMDVDCALFPTEEEEGFVRHFIHPHPLKLFEKMDKFCRICNKLCLGPTCGCSKCNFYFHQSCMDTLLPWVQHFFHPCTLVLCTFPGYKCGGCDKKCSNLSFRCGKCRFELGVKCFLLSQLKSDQPLKLPLKIQHFFHPCPLVLRISSSFFCNACYGHKSALTYRCAQCDFDMDVECAWLPTTKAEDGEEQIQHFSHPHPLTLFQMMAEYKARCKICGKDCSGHNYGCSQCSFYIHKSCMDNLPQKIQHSFHQCPLSLTTFPFNQCRACNKESSGLFFQCAKCRFRLCIECSLLPEKKSNIHEKIQTYIHRHPLTLSETSIADEVLCNVCEEHCLGFVYCCTRCNVHLHPSCMDILPEKIAHSFHSCYLYPMTTQSRKCSACDKIYSGLAYGCRHQCKFELCIPCSILPTIESDDGGKIQHFLHGHPLLLYERHAVNGDSCIACQKHCLGPTYGCSRCNFFLHKSCAALPKKMEHFYHQSHPLSLSNIDSKTSKEKRCNLCLKSCKGYAFVCWLCNFQLDIECATLVPTLNYKDHKHLLIALENIHGKLSCTICNASCLGSPTLRCLFCDYNLHVVCGPLPSTIKHTRHVDALILKDYYVDDGDDDDDFYCDACEEPRNPRDCVYCCAEGCPFISHVNCVASEVVASLRGDCGDVRLRTIGRRIKSYVISRDLALKQMKQNETENDAREECQPALSWNDIVMSLNEAEHREIGDIQERHIEDFEAVMKLKRGKGKLSLESKGKYTFPYTEESFMEFMGSSDSDAFQLPGFLSEYNEFVNVGENLVPSALIPIFQNLFSTHGDVSSETTTNPKVKSIAFFFLCGVLQSMRATLVVDITGHEFRQWLTYLKFVKRAGFKIQFLFEHMERVARAHFGVQARKFINEAHARQQKEIECIAKNIMKQTAKLEESKIELGALKEKQEAHKRCVQSADTTTSFMKQCFKDAAAMKWKPATYDLL